MKPLYTGSEWSMELIDTLWTHIEDIGRNTFGFDPYPAQIEIITAEQMLDCYSNAAMPINYSHWSFGKTFVQNERQYEKGIQGLAYEVVINTNPCIAYCMETNTATMQALVLAHASCVDADTECLTDAGWVKISNYDGQKIAQYTDDGRMHFAEPIRYIKTKTDKFFHLSATGVSQNVTPDHTMIYRDPRGKLKKETAQMFTDRHLNKTRGHSGKFITHFKYSGPGLELSDAEIKLAVAIKADGSFHAKVNSGHFNCVPHDRVRFHLKKERKIERLLNILNELGIKWDMSDTYGGRKKVVFNVPVGRYTKTFDASWYGANANQLAVIGEEVLYWDGDQQNSFSSTNKGCADYVQFVWAAMGFGTSIYTSVVEGKKDCYNVRKSPYAERSISRSRGGMRNRIEELPGGTAYCFTTDTGMWVARRDNCIFITGNCGHSHFFKNNYLFRGWTEADTILDYLRFARNYIKSCEEKYGAAEVEAILDACHSLQMNGVDKYRKPARLSDELAEQRAKAWSKYADESFNDMWRTIPKRGNAESARTDKIREENILYFIEKNSPCLKDWQREIVRIVRKVAQYFYPQRQTQLMNEGTATFVHHLIMTEMHDRGLIDAGSYLEFLASHTAVVTQLGWDSKYYHGINVYALGFAMFQDIRRICAQPDEEDRKWFPDIAGTDWLATIKDIIANYRDESFVLQFLSPKIARQFKLFSVHVKEDSGYVEVNATHDDDSFLDVRRTLAEQYDLSRVVPQIEVVGVDWDTDRTLYLEHRTKNKQRLDYHSMRRTVNYMHTLWGHPVKMEYVDLNGAPIDEI